MATPGELLTVLAQAYNTAGVPIYGVDFDFTTNQDRATGCNASHRCPPNPTGDLYIYDYDPSTPVMLEATHGKHTDGVMIHSGGGFVSSSNHVGCSFASGGGASGAALASLLLLLAMLVTHQRRTRGGRVPLAHA